MSSIRKLAESIQRLTNVGIALSAEKDINKFFMMTLGEALYFTNADACSIYTISDDEKFLDFKVVCTLSKNLRLGMADTSQWPAIPLYDNKGKKRMKNFVSYVVHTGKPLSIDDVYDQDLFDNSGTKEYDSKNDYLCKSMTAVPLKNHESKVLGVVQLINALNDKGEIISFSKRNVMMLSSLASQAAIALSNKKLIKNLEDLLYKFIKSIAAAIDRKSKNTGGHIDRVASLSEMLSQKIQDDQKYYPDIHFTADELKEISLAGWMHDVGKITTPVYIQDKARKLETIFDRLELISTRFELVMNVIENDILCNKKGNGKELKELQKKLDKYLDFIKICNVGGEFMTDENLAMLDEIYTFKYKTNNKEYFLINENEYYNLKIPRGTLLFEEILKMREHALVSYEMLSELTFPRKFRNVPLYASAHHEKINGQGYPNKLSDEQLPLQARIIAIADIFEALTASDRPYKSGKTLSETFKILGFMAKDREIDPKLLNLLIDSGLYMVYARKYLKEEQINKIDIDKIKAVYN